MLVVAALCGAADAPAHAQPAVSPTTKRTPARRWLVDAGLLLAKPAALETGLSSGVELSFLRGDMLAWGARASWSAASEFPPGAALRHDEIRLRATAALLARLGRARVGLRLGLGATIVHEDSDPIDNETSGFGVLPAPSPSTTWRVLPAAELEALLVLRVVGDFGVSVSGGPSLHFSSDGAAIGWLGTVGVVWQR